MYLHFAHKYFRNCYLFHVPFKGYEKIGFILLTDQSLHFIILENLFIEVQIWSSFMYDRQVKKVWKKISQRPISYQPRKSVQNINSDSYLFNRLRRLMSLKSDSLGAG